MKPTDYTKFATDEKHQVCPKCGQVGRIYGYSDSLVYVHLESGCGISARPVESCLVIKEAK